MKVVCKYASYSALGTLLAIATLSQGTLYSTSLLGRRDAWTDLPTLCVLSLVPSGGVSVVVFHQDCSALHWFALQIGIRYYRIENR